MTAPVARRGFTKESVNELVSRRAEPEWLRERRLAAWTLYSDMPMPSREDEEWRRTDLRGLHLDDVESLDSTAVTPMSAGTLLPEAEKNERYGGFLGLQNAEAVEYRLDDDLQK